MDFQQMNQIMLFLYNSKIIFDKSVYKYGVYKEVLLNLYPRHSDYKIKKIFDELIKYNYISKIECNKSFKYQFNAFNLFSVDKINKKIDEKPQFDENGSVIVYFD